MAKTKIQTLSIDLLRLDGGTQARIKINEEIVDDYAEVISNEGEEWPFEEIDVFHDGTEYFVADGFHRTLAAIRMKRSSLPCRVHQGTAKDARIFGMTANDTHGLRMTRKDKRACVIWLLKNEKLMTQDVIAIKAGVDERTVRRIVSERKKVRSNRTMSGSTTKPQQKSTKTNSHPTEQPDSSELSADESMSETDAETSEVSASSSASEPTSAKSASAKSASVKSPSVTAGVVLDGLGKPVPPEFREANELGIQLLSLGREVDRFRALAKELSAQPGGEFLHLQNVDERVRALKNVFQDARYYALCPHCKGKTGEPCNKCSGRGWLPEFLKGTIS